MDQEFQADPVTSAPVRGRMWRSRRLGAVLAVGALIALTIGGSAASAASASATGGDRPAAEAPTGPDATTADDAFSKFAACMRSHGIDMPEPTRIEATAGVDGPLPALPDDAVSSGVVVSTGTAQLVFGSTGAPAMDPAFEAANAACLPILEAAGIGEAGSEIAGSGTIVIAGPDGADLPVLEAFPKP